MRIAIFSDIHSNLEALDTALKDMRDRRVDRRICLGDIVGYGANPRECLDRVRSEADVVVLGNHDLAAIRPSLLAEFSSGAVSGMRWTMSCLTEGDRDHLRSLPASVSEDGNLYTHAAPGGTWDFPYLTNGFTARLHARSFTERLCFIGHVHRPDVFAMVPRPGLAVGMYTVTDRFIINVGSVGQPRDGDPRLAYGILDTVAGTWEIVRLVYDVDTAMRKILDAGIAPKIATRLKTGV